MAQIKKVIESLCQVLNSFGFSECLAEDFRLCKYNKPEPIKKMWKLLYELICYNHNESLKQSQNEIFDKISADTLILCIKNELMRKGYYCEDFLKLPHSFEDGSSREILVAIGWYISTQNILKKFINSCHTAFDYEFSRELALESLDVNDINSEIESVKLQLATNNKSLDAQLRLLKWLSGNIRHKINGLNSCLNEKSKLANSLHKYTEDCGPYSFGHLSTFELYLLKNASLIPKFEKVIQDNTQLLTILNNWLQNENSFWKWMESVVDEKIQENASQNSLDREDDVQSQDLLNSIMMNLSEVQLNRLRSSKKQFDTSKFNLMNLIVKASNYEADSAEQLTEDEDILLANFESSLQENFTEILNSKEIKEPLLKTKPHSLFDFDQTRLNFSQKPKVKDFQTFDDRIKKMEKIASANKTNLSNELKRSVDQCETLTTNLADAYMIMK